MPPKKTRQKPTERAEHMLIERILDGTYQAGSALPGERDLCKEFGVARPALREALQRLAREGWLDIQQGKATHVNDFMRRGNLTMLNRMLRSGNGFPASLVPDLLEVWELLVPTYTRRAIENDSKPIARLLAGYAGLEDGPVPYATAQWRLHRALLDACGNPIYGLMLGSFDAFYRRIGVRFYADPQARAEARRVWQALYGAALTSDGEAAARAMQEFMTMTRESWWQRVAGSPGELWIEAEDSFSGEMKDENTAD